MIKQSILLLAFSLLSTSGNARTWDDSLDGSPNSQIEFIDPKSFNVLTEPFGRNSSQAWPQGSKVPSIQVFDEEFYNVLGDGPFMKLIAQDEDYAFAHEAPIYLADTDEIFFCSNAGGDKGRSGLDQDNVIFKLPLSNVSHEGDQLLEPITVDVQPPVNMTNGGVLYKNQLLLATEGRGESAPRMALVNPYPPYNSTVLVNNYFGRQFASLNDVAVHPKSGAIFFTDSVYGPLQDFRPDPLINPVQVYRFEPDTGHLKVVADRFVHSNGIAFSVDGNTAYVSDTGPANGFAPQDPTQPSSVYAYDVASEEQGQYFHDRRIFAYADSGFPDGITVDSNDNVYVAVGDGVAVYNKAGTLLGKFFIGETSAHAGFAGDGRLIILAETKVYLAQFNAKPNPTA